MEVPVSPGATERERLLAPGQGVSAGSESTHVVECPIYCLREVFKNKKGVNSPCLFEELHKIIRECLLLLP